MNPGNPAPDDGDGIPFLSSIGFAITARCPAACHHCIVEAGPHRREEMPLADAGDWMEQAAAYRRGHIKSVVITGGEPFSNLALLREVLDRALSARLVPIVLTNAHWATSLSAAIELLSTLPAIRMLSVSTDVHHQRFIPLQYAKNALLAARELGLPHSAAVCYEHEDDPAYRNTRSELAGVLGEDGVVCSARTIRTGRALLKLKAEHFELTHDDPVFACTAADSPTVFWDGRVIGCMGIVKQLPPGHPLLLGNLRETPLEEILDAAEGNIALQLLRIWGPGRLLAMLRESGAVQYLPVTFDKHGCCDLCYAMAAEPRLIRQVLELTADCALAEKVDYARLFYLDEVNPWTSNPAKPLS